VLAWNDARLVFHKTPSIPCAGIPVRQTVGMRENADEISRSIPASAIDSEGELVQ
jgi:hypothetical protein